MSAPKKKVLIVDDNPAIRESVRLAIEEQDFLDIEVTESSNVASGIKQLEKVNPDIIILDLHMPDKTGFDFIDIMYKKKRFAATKVIMLTADDTLDNIFSAEHKGVSAYHFLSKPFNISDLQALVLSLCLPSKL